MSSTILIIDDDAKLNKLLTEFLGDFGFSTLSATHPKDGLKKLKHKSPDLVILDVMLPGMDGFEVCKTIRQNSSVPIIMLTARGELMDKVVGLELGADDYLVKPFELEELVARMQALVRRSDHGKKKPLRVGDLEIDFGKMQVQRAGRAIELNRSCLKILTLLMQASPNVVSRKEIEHALWSDMPPGSDALRSHIYTLRQAIDKPYERHLIHTVHGIGYKLVDPNDLPT